MHRPVLCSVNIHEPCRVVPLGQSMNVLVPDYNAITTPWNGKELIRGLVYMLQKILGSRVYFTFVRLLPRNCCHYTSHTVILHLHASVSPGPAQQFIPYHIWLLLYQQLHLNGKASYHTVQALLTSHLLLM